MRTDTLNWVERDISMDHVGNNTCKATGVANLSLHVDQVRIRYQILQGFSVSFDLRAGTNTYGTIAPNYCLGIEAWAAKGSNTDLAIAEGGFIWRDANSKYVRVTDIRISIFLRCKNISCLMAPFISNPLRLPTFVLFGLRVFKKLLEAIQEFQTNRNVPSKSANNELSNGKCLLKHVPSLSSCFIGDTDVRNDDSVSENG